MGHQSETIRVPDEPKRISLPTKLIVGSAGVIFAAGMVWNTIRGAEQQVQDHEARIVKLEQSQQDINLIKSDIHWMREIMEGRAGGSRGAALSMAHGGPKASESISDTP